MLFSDREGDWRTWPRIEMHRVLRLNHTTMAVLHVYNTLQG